MEACVSDDSICFPSTCPWVSVAQVDAGGVLIAQTQTINMWVDEMGRLYINRKSLCNNFSSFSFYSLFANEVVTHLIILTKQDFLFIVDTEDVLQGEVGESRMPLSHKAGPLFHYDALAQRRFKAALNLVKRHIIDFNVIVDLYG